MAQRKKRQYKPSDRILDLPADEKAQLHDLREMVSNMTAAVQLGDVEEVQAWADKIELHCETCIFKHDRKKQGK